MTSERFDRLQRNALFGEGGFDRWRETTVFLVGAGTLGSHAAPAVVRSGANVVVCDPDEVSESNRGTALLDEVGRPKAECVRDACEAIRPGSAKALPFDVRRAGVAHLARADVLVDATDDPNLAAYLTEVSNGLGVPLLRVAVSGDGERQIARVSASDGGNGHSCQMCSWSVDELHTHHAVEHCPGNVPDAPPETVTTNGTSMVAAGLLLNQLMTLVGPNAGEVLDHEAYFDLASFHALRFRRPHNEECLSGHLRWEPVPLGRACHVSSLADVMLAAREHVGLPQRLEVFGHALWTRAQCACGESQPGLGTWWNPPTCQHCGGETDWQAGSDRVHWLPAPTDDRAYLSRPVTDFGIPEGAMFVVRSEDRTVRLLADLD